MRVIYRLHTENMKGVGRGGQVGGGHRLRRPVVPGDGPRPLSAPDVGRRRNGTGDAGDQGRHRLPPVAYGDGVCVQGPARLLRWQVPAGYWHPGEGSQSAPFLRGVVALSRQAVEGIRGVSESDMGQLAERRQAGLPRRVLQLQPDDPLFQPRPQRVSRPQGIHRSGQRFQLPSGR